MTRSIIVGIVLEGLLLFQLWMAIVIGSRRLVAWWCAFAIVNAFLLGNHFRKDRDLRTVQNMITELREDMKIVEQMKTEYETRLVEIRKP